MPPPLPTRRLGYSPLNVSAIGLGLMSLSGTYGASSDDNGLSVIHEAIDSGITFLDSADMYGWGHNETLLGRALQGRRERVVLATKFGQTRQAGGGNGVDGSPAYVQRACEASLQRLGLDVIDLYYVHRIDPKVPIEDTVGAMARLVEQGKVRALGLCEASPATIRRAHAVHPLAAIQTEYSLLYREPAEETLRTTRALGIGFVAYSPLGRSLLTGTVQSVDAVANDRRKDHPRFHAGNFERNRALAATLEGMARAKGCQPGQLALAWLLAQGEDIVPIPGTKQVARIAENRGALDVSLSPAEVAALSAAFPAGAAAGTRYPEGGMKGVYL
ncbi:MAG: aldo/keto reductase [Rhodoferax sp.]|jgi:aryl-alcohol dehydrogenase-like predicted oxidoreductase|nr:aldo/keto reductase [Rhodoferax sp.]